MIKVMGPTQVIIRDAILRNTERENQFNDIREGLAVNRNEAKALYYAYNYHATEEYLKDILKGFKEDELYS